MNGPQYREGSSFTRNTVSQKDKKPHTAGLDDTAIPHKDIKIKITEIKPLEKKLNTVNPYMSPFLMNVIK